MFGTGLAAFGRVAPESEASSKRTKRQQPTQAYHPQLHGNYVGAVRWRAAVSSAPHKSTLLTGTTCSFAP